MALTLDDDAVLLDSGIRMKFIRDAEYSPAPPLVGIFDGEQTLLQCDDQGRLLINATVNPTGDVIFKAYDQTDTLQDLRSILDPITSNYALVTQDPRLKFTGDKLKVEATVIAAPTAGASEDKYGEITGLAAGGWNTIVSYTVPALKIFHLRHAMVSGTNKATYRVLWGEGNILAKKRTYYTQFNEDFFFETDDTLGKTFVAGDVVYVDVNHSNILEIGDFNATISGRLEDA